MKKGGQIASLGAMLLILAALTFTNRRAASGDPATSGGSCCPLIQSLNTMAPSLETNGVHPIAIRTTQVVTKPF